MGLADLNFFAQMATVTRQFEAERLALITRQIVAALTPEDAAERWTAMAADGAEAAFFVATPHHCAVGTKPA